MQNWEIEAKERNSAIDAKLAEMNLTVESAFIPFSKSRNAPRRDPLKAEGWASLNWNVTLKQNGREIITTEYSAGIAHCPGYSRNKVPAQFKTHNYTYKNSEGKRVYRKATERESLEQFRKAIAEAEIESGFHMEFNFQSYGEMFKVKRFTTAEGLKRRAIEPCSRDVIHGLIMDSSVLECSSFEDWAMDYGYETDSRKAESVYKQCLAIALKILAALGHENLAKLRELFQDY